MLHLNLCGHDVELPAAARCPLRRRALLVSAGALALSAQGRANDKFPSRAVRIVVPVAPGYATDFLARLTGEKIRTSLNQTIVVENRAGGAAGNVGSEYVARAVPDGYTLLFASPGPLAINKFLYPRLGFDPAAFVPIAIVASAVNVVVVRSDSSFRSLSDILEAARKAPGALSYASGGAGTTQHLAAELLKARAGRLNILHVPYKGAAAAMNGFIQGQADFMFAELGNTMPHILGGRVRPIAVGSTTRNAALANVPAVAESLPGFASTAWYGLVGPPRMPTEIAALLSTAVADALRQPDVSAKLQAMHIQPVGSTPLEMARFVREESERWGKVIREGNIGVE